MVYLNSRAEDDLFGILVGLLTWEKHLIEYEHAESYVNDIKNECLSIDKLNYHINCRYTDHKNYGQKVHQYRRSKNTSWYIIYNIDRTNKIVYIEHIMQNQTTKMIT